MTYCPDIWKGLYVRKTSSQSVELGFCCQSGTAKLEPGTSFKQARAQIQQSQETFCSSCRSAESQGFRSRREAIIDWYSGAEVKQDHNDDLICLDWNTENICNLACISCGPVFSSRWSQEIKNYSFFKSETNSYSNNRENKFYEQLDLSRLKKVYFNGGEPLLNRDHIEILKRVNLADCEVSYNTNCTVIPSAEVLELWSQARLLRLYLSIDATESAFEFIRWPAQWNQVLELVDFLKSLPFNVIIDITYTVGIHNILELDATLEWQKKYLATNSQGDPVSFNIQSISPFSHGGRVLNLKNLDPKLSQEIIKRIDTAKTHYQWPALLQTLEKSQNSTLWINYLREVSQIRGLDWEKSLFRLSSLL